MSGSSGTATCAQGANPSAIKRGRRLPYSLLLIALLLGAAILQKDEGRGFPTTGPRSKTQWAHLYGNLPLSFEANHGQTDARVKFLSHGRGYALFLTSSEAVVTLKSPSPTAPGQKSPDPDTALRLQLLGVNAHAAVNGTDELPGKTNYFIGNDPKKWRTDIPTYAKVRYESVYPGVDLVYYGAQGGELEYDFVVAPGANPQAITLGIDTQANAPLRINSGGDLVVSLRGGDVQLHKPVVYQAPAPSGLRAANNGTRTAVEGQYALDAQNHVHFQLGPYDHNRPLVIDPVLIYATYLGGSGGDTGFAIAIDTLLDAYITGVTNSTNFPDTTAASYHGNGDVFITKLNSAGTNVLFSTLVGGSGADAGTAIAVSNGSSYITGYTDSPDFPTHVSVSTTATPFQTNFGGVTDAFVLELNTVGNAIVYSSFLGGTNLDVGQGIAVDSSGNAYVTGGTESANFPIFNALQSINNGSEDAFITKVNFSGTQILYSTYLGGSQADVGQSIQIDSSNNMYIAGTTFSPDFLTLNRPVATPLQSILGGGSDAFVTELNAAGTSLPFSTYLGGSGADAAYGLALDSSNNVYITGSTVSTNFPVTSGAFQPSLKGSSDAFVSKLNAAGTSLGYSTYLGGSGVDQGNAIAVTPAGIAYVTGFTESTDFPTKNPVQAILGLSTNTAYCGTAPCADAFVTQFNASGSALTYSTYLGGNGPDFGEGIVLDNTGDPYIVGSTSSTNFPAVWGGSYSSSLTGTAGNAFVAKIDSANNSNIAILPSTVKFGTETINVTSALQQIYIYNPSTTPLVITQIQTGLIGNSATVFVESDNCVGTLPGGGEYCTMNVSFTPNSIGNITDQITITDNAGGLVGAQQTINLTGTGVTAATAVTVQPTSLSFTSQNVGTSSPPQTVTITNTGTATLNITQISLGLSVDFSETNTCGNAPLFDALPVGGSCNVSVVFNPTASGTRNATLNITDTATGSPQTVALTGIAAAAFSLTSPSAVNPTLIGSTQTTFVIQANGPSNFNGSISLACSSGSTCAFQANPIFVGSSTTMTISNLTSSLGNPYTFYVTGTSGSQSYQLQLNLEFSDYTLSGTPSIVTVEAGTSASYNILINPLFTFNQAVLLQCASGLPPDSTCSFTNNTPAPNGTTPIATGLSISTVKYLPTSTHAPPAFPSGKLPPLIFGILSLAGLASLALGNRRRARHGRLGSAWLGLRLAILSLILALNLALVTCRPLALVQSGTTTGNYTITIAGYLNSNTTVVRYTTVALAVTATPVP